MAEYVSVPVSDELHALLEQRAREEDTTVEELATAALRAAVRDPRLDAATAVYRDFVALHGDGFDEAFPEDAPGHVRAGRAA
jgi:hypothetical protein